MIKDGKKNSQAHKLGLLYAKHIMELDPVVRKLAKVSGGGFWDKFTSGMKSVAKVIPAAVATAGAVTGQPEIVAPALALHAAVNGGGKNSNALNEFITKHKGSGAKKKRKVSDKMKRRNALIRKLMKEKGMKMTQASKHIKANNLKY